MSSATFRHKIDNQPVQILFVAISKILGCMGLGFNTSNRLRLDSGNAVPFGDIF